jgi:hypothetical protein
MKFKKMAKSLTGISTPVFGISWSPLETDREIVRPQRTKIMCLLPGHTLGDIGHTMVRNVIILL